MNGLKGGEMNITVKHRVSIILEGEEIDDLIRILHIAHERFSGENRIDSGHAKTPYINSAREDACELIERIYIELPCDWGKPTLH